MFERAKIPPLFPDQKKSVEFELRTGSVCDWSEPGTGKTRVRLEVFDRRRGQGGKNMLVLCSKSLIRSAWEMDARRYTGWLKVSCGFAENRDDAFKAKADIYVTNHDAAKWLASKPAAFFSRFDYLVIDESEAFKHHTSQRSKAVYKVAQFFKYRTIMNGEPTPNGVLDMWHQVKIVDDGKRLGTSFYSFRAACCVPEQTGPQPNMVKWVDREGIEDQVTDLVADISIRNKLKGLPKNHVPPPTPFYLSKKQARAYEQMEREALASLKTGEVNAVNAASVVTKLLQIASGAVYDGEHKYHVIDTSRYELVVDIAKARKHSIVFFLWQHQRDLLEAQLKSEGLTYAVIDGSVRSASRRSELVSQYQQGMYRTILLHPKSAAHGLTLTKATATIWASPTYDLSWFNQGNHRAHRTGQTEETTTHRIIAEGTIEEQVEAKRGDKSLRAMDLLRAIEERS